MESRWAQWQVVGLVLLGLLLAGAAFVVLLRLRKGVTPAETLSTKSPQAKQLYTLALDWAAKGDDDEAIRGFTEATTLDPEFAEAYVELADLYGSEEREKCRAAASKALALSASLPRLRLVSEGLRHECDDEWEEARKIYQLLVDSYPTYADGHLFLAAASIETGRPEDAIKPLRRCIDLQPNSTYCNYELMMLLVESDQFDAILGSYRSLQQRGISYAWFSEPVALALWGKGDLSGAAQQLTELGNAKVRGVGVHGPAHLKESRLWLIDMALYEGKLSEARNRLEEVLDEPDQSAGDRSGHMVYLAKLQLLAGNRTEAESLATRAIRGSDDHSVQARAIRVLADLGARAETMSALERWKSKRSRATTLDDASAEHFVIGAIALRHDRQPVAAIDELTQASERHRDLEAEYLLSQAYMEAGRWTDAIQTLDRLIRSKGAIISECPPSIWPLSFLLRAECLEKLGKNQDALKDYLKFLDLWDHADPGIKQVTEAQKGKLRLSR